MNGIWGTHIPAISHRLGIDTATLGIALLCIAVGSIVTQPPVGWLVGMTGSRPVAAIAAVLMPASLLVPVNAPNLTTLCIGLFLMGASFGAFGVAANLQGTEVEAIRQRPTISMFHAFFSIGALLGAAAGGWVTAIGAGNGSGASVAAIALIALGLVASFNFLPSRPRPSGEPRFAWPSRALVALATITFLCFGIEGAILDWSALYLSSAKGANLAFAASGYALFATLMAIGRFTGSSVVARIGDRATVSGGGVLIAVGLALAIGSPIAALSTIGFGLVGLGAANIVPRSFSASARTPGLPPGIGIAVVATTGFCGFLATPPIIGFVAHAFSLSAALSLLVLSGVAVAILAARANWHPLAGTKA